MKLQLAKDLVRIVDELEQAEPEISTERLIGVAAEYARDNLNRPIYEEDIVEALALCGVGWEESHDGVTEVACPECARKGKALASNPECPLCAGRKDLGR